MSAARPQCACIAPTRRLAVVPSTAELARQGLSFERVDSREENPVRLRHHGAAIGVFASKHASLPTLQRLYNQ